MRYFSIALLAALTTMGCGSVDMKSGGIDGGGGEGGQAGAEQATGGVGGQAPDGSAGAGGGGAGGQTVDAGCVPTMCSICSNGVAMPVNDGTPCGTASCDSTNKLTTSYACKAGVCTTTTLDCTKEWCLHPGSGDHLACAPSQSNVCVVGDPSQYPNGCGCLSGTGSMPFITDPVACP